MKYFYGEFDGSEFPTSDKLFQFDKLAQFILQHGESAMRALEQMLENGDDQQLSDLIEQLIKDGLLDKDGKGRLRLTPRAVGRMQRKALMEVFAHLRRGTREGHEKVTAGQGGERIEGTKPYQFGDPVSEIDLHATLRNALAGALKTTDSPSQYSGRGRGGGPSDAETRKDTNASPPSPQPPPGVPGGGGSVRINFVERDFELHLHEGTTSCSTVVLLDLSGSMMRYGRFLAAKKVALAMQSLVRSRFPQDSIDFVGFYSGAMKIPEIALPLVMPKPVTVYDYSVRLKCKIDQIDQAPQHFTNLHMGLQLARRILRRRMSENKQIFIITDGQPTAHLEGDYVYLLYPPDERSTMATLKEALLALREGCRFSTFALIEDYWGMDWVGFVDQLTKLTKGVAFYTNADELSGCIMESYLSGRKKKTYIS